jgi:hypothetical protein
MPVYSLRMPEQCQPTSQDIENAAIRAAIADKQNAAYREVMAWADKTMAPELYPSGGSAYYAAVSGVRVKPRNETLAPRSFGHPTDAFLEARIPRNFLRDCLTGGLAIAPTMSETNPLTPDSRSYEMGQGYHERGSAELEARDGFRRRMDGRGGRCRIKERTQGRSGGIAS